LSRPCYSATNMRYLSFIIILFSLLAGCRSKEKIENFSETTILTLYSTHSNIWNRHWVDIFSKFENDNNCIVEITSFNNSQTLYDGLLEDPTADVILGLDNIIYSVENIDSLFIPYEPNKFSEINEDLIFDNSTRLIPIAYGDLALIYNQDEIEDPPYTFGIMQDGFFKNKLLIPDPRTSSIGKGFLIWSISTFGENGYGHFWRSIRENIHTITSNWDEAYNMFLAEEAPIVLGYSTTPLYHIVNDSVTVIRSVIPSEGGFSIIEAAGIFHSTRNLALSKKMIDFLLSDGFQGTLLENKLMIPATMNDRPPELDDFPVMTNNFTNTLSVNSVRKNYKGWLKRWISLTID